MVNRPILVGFCCTLIASSAFAQKTARDWSQKAQELYSARNYEQSADAYDACIKAGAVSPNTYYQAACSSALAGRQDVAFRWLSESIARGWRDVDHLKADADFESLQSDARWPDSVQKCVQARKAFLKSLKYPELHLELMEMKRIDQEIRSLDHLRVNNHGTDSKTSDGHEHEHDEIDQEHDEDEAHSPHGSEMHLVDSKNTARIKEIVAEFGWPTKSLVGEDGATAAWLLVQHADRDTKFQRRCLDLMKAAPKGEVSSVEVAYLTDRVLVNEGKKQLYGTQFWFVDGEMAPRPIKDRANLEKRRKAAGMTSFAEYERHMTGPHDQ